MSNNFIDLCAGIGGFHQSLKKYGDCLLTADIDKFCKTSYLGNYSTAKWVDDVKSIVPNKVDNFDILAAGFPCQAFSLAGKQLGFDDARGTIFFDIAKIVKEKKPKVIFLENVKNLLSHDKGNTFKVICNTLFELGYHVHYFLINSQYFVPQRRERIYFVCIRNDIISKDEFKVIVDTINHKYELAKQNEPIRISSILEKNVDEKYTISNKLWDFLREHAKKHEKKGNGFGYGLVDPTKDINTRTITARYYKDGSEILIKQEGKNPRKLTPKECSRLMGFPDDYKILVSDTQAYKQFGNSVVVPVVKMIVETALDRLKYLKKL